MSMTKGILFDFDGVLTKRYESAYYLYQHIISELSGKDIHSLDVEEMVQRCLIWDQYGIYNKSFTMNNIKENWFDDMDVNYWKRYWYDNFDKYQIVSDDAYEVLNELKKEYKLGILSNGNSISQHNKIKHSGLKPLFDSVMVCGDYDIQKPDTRIFQLACEKLGTKCEDTFMVGDTFFSDISGAIRSGIKPVWYSFERKSVSDMNVPIVHNFKEVKEYFLGDKDEIL